MEEAQAAQQHDDEESQDLGLDLTNAVDNLGAATAASSSDK